jgi:SAM-dependent methyltransferase
MLRAILKVGADLRQAYSRARRIGGANRFSAADRADDQWARVIMNRETERLVCSINPEMRSALEISGDSWKKRATFRQYRSVDFQTLDICAGPLQDEKFDIVIAEQVFEHLLWPYRAVRHVYQMLNEDGVFLLTTPFLIKIHQYPVDCSRWTELGIRHLLAEGGFNIDLITTGSWGNRACIKANWKQWKIYHPWRHTLNNEPDFPVVVWALARR